MWINLRKAYKICVCMGKCTRQEVMWLFKNYIFWIIKVIIFLQTTLVPFLIDPSLQATKWLKSNMSSSQLEVVNNHVRFQSTKLFCSYYFKICNYLLISVAPILNLFYLYILQDANLLTAVEMAVRFGKTLLIQDVDGIHPVLLPLLRHDLINQGIQFILHRNGCKVSFVWI